VTVSPLREPAGAPREAEVWIPLSDGARLAARLWLPPEAESRPVPAVVEVSPYRHDDHTRRRDLVRHPYFAEHGYASLRVDIRGSGSSDGVLRDEYTELEQRDVCETLAWIAAQPWSTGSVGMIGISWGGFAALQAAALAPPALKAVIVVCASADRYAADVKYKGGCLLATELLPWSSTMLAMNARPPDPRRAGEGWRDLWLERLEESTPFAEAWLTHQHRDDYWRSGSPADNYGAVSCPVFAVGGWADPYRQAVLELLERLECPRKGLIGPWSHQYPDEGSPGPAIDFRRECVRWWNHWLKGTDAGVMDEPALTVWMQEAPSLRRRARRRRGGWVAERAWPSEQVAVSSWYLGEGSLLESDVPRLELCVAGSESCGADAGAWCPWDERELPPGQLDDDALSLCFTTAPLERRMELLGSPAVVLELAADRPVAAVAVRLCAIAPDGASTLLTRGLLNLAHREGSEKPEPLVPGQRETVHVSLDGIAYALPPGHRLRLAVSPTYWPWMWPSPEPVTLSVWTGASRLELPLRSPGEAEVEPPSFGEPTGNETASLCDCKRALTVDGGRSELVVNRKRGHRRVREDGLEVGGSQFDTFTIVEGDPLSAAVNCRRTMSIARGPWSARVETKSTMTADREHFYLVNLVEAFENGERIFSSQRSFEAPRDLL
jgi:putative CocE/NonD family hydrolase